MATRSNIYVKLKQETKGQTLKFNPTLISEDYSTECPIPDVQVPENANFIGIYHHWDGYISALGTTLQNHYQDYDKILNVLMMGDMSTINGRVESYRGWRGEDTPPHFYTEDELNPKKALQEEYAYLYDNGVWYVCSNYEYVEDENGLTNPVWELLSEVIEKSKELKNKKL